MQITQQVVPLLARRSIARCLACNTARACTKLFSTHHLPAAQDSLQHSSHPNYLHCLCTLPANAAPHCFRAQTRQHENPSSPNLVTMRCICSQKAQHLNRFRHLVGPGVVRCTRGSCITTTCQRTKTNDIDAMHLAFLHSSLLVSWAVLPTLHHHL